MLRGVRFTGPVAAAVDSEVEGSRVSQVFLKGFHKLVSRQVIFLQRFSCLIMLLPASFATFLL